MDLRNTLNLPDADATIPMKANLAALEPKILAEWSQLSGEKLGIYHFIQASRKDKPSFVLHDGPPYTNSPIHIGTALNKVLKDFVVKSRTMMGFRAPYVPGFDNHGLPIEQAVVKKLAEQKITPDILTLRQACRAHAAEFIKIQTEQFQRLGVFGLWEKPYTTMDFRFEAEIIRVFKRVAEQGYVYKGLRPTLWSPTSRTALADTEIVYHEHVSKAIYVRFALREDPNRLFEAFPNLYTIIWTTTPWTIPANLAVAFHPELSYVVVGSDHFKTPEGAACFYIIAEALLPKVAEALGWTNYSVKETLDGINLDHAEFSHPIFDRPSIAVMANYVTTEDGTGVVHTAPSHGRDDFFTGQKYGLPVPNTVDERGVLTEEAGEFAGTYFKACDTVVVDRLKEVGALLDVRDYQHSYPYAERDDQPVIFRATEQWFVALDPLREQMLEQIQQVEWFPASGQNRIEAMIRNRPDWCISRQRPWGVGIPVFYGANSREPVLDPIAIEAVAKMVEEEGSDAWFVKDASQILPVGYKHPKTGETEFSKETDVLDVWFDSGSTSLCVLEGNVEPAWKEHWPADVYLEGSDQHRGWFNSSLILATAIHGRAPYRAVVTHGFVTDDKGLKMSKRLGNVVDPLKAADQFGADVLRYWVASVDYANDVPCSEALLKQFGENYRNVRNTLRFLLSNLGGFDGLPVPLLPLDEWAVEQTDLLVDECVKAYGSYDFGAVMNGVHNFCREELSKFYVDVIKDRMYCEAPHSDLRRSGQAASLAILMRLLKLIAPILVFTAEETWHKLNEVVPGSAPGSVHTLTFDQPSEARLEEIEGSELQLRYSTLRGVRDDVFAALERWKGTGEVKDGQDAIGIISEQGDVMANLQSFDLDELANLLKLSWVELKTGEPSIDFRKSEYLKCERSRVRRPDVALVDGVPLSARDQRVLKQLEGAI